jgi:CRISPR type III-A-associated RAMP protein Csm5
VKASRDAVAFALKLTPLTPLLVGSGRTLNRFDYTVTVNPRSGAPLLRVLDTERFIEESPLDPQKKVEAIEKRSSAVLDRYSRYVLSCQFRQAREGLELVEFHRDGRGEPVAPASALRGMVRTAVLFSLASGRPEAIREGVEGALQGRWRRERAAEKIERRLLGSREEDGLRALRIDEPSPVSNEDLRAYEAQVLSLAGGSLRPKLSLFVEALNPRSGAAFEYRVSIDRAVLRREAPGASKTAVEKVLESRETLLAALRRFGEGLQDAERRFYGDAGARDLARLLDAALRRAEGRIALPFGFGAGWRSKTLGLLLGPEGLMRLAPLLSPGRAYYRDGPRPVFPKTRRWVLDAGRPAEPLGWAAVE